MVIHHTTALFAASNTVSFAWTCLSMRVYNGHNAGRLKSGIYEVLTALLLDVRSC